MNFPDPNLPSIVLVDDSQDDTFLLRHELRLGGIANPITAFDSACAALSFFRAPFLIHPAPHLLFTDVKMHGAWDLIRELRDLARWDDMKIAVLTYSNDPLDVRRALELRTDGYLLKFPAPENLADFVRKGPSFALPRRVDGAAHALCA